MVSRKCSCDFSVTSHKNEMEVSAESETVDYTKEDTGYTLDSEKTPLLTDSSLDIRPADRFSFAYVTFMLLGIVVLLPWNFFITANDYWMYKFRNTSADAAAPIEDRTELQTLFTSYLSITSNLPVVIFLWLNTLLSQRIPQHIRIGFSQLVMILLFIITSVLVNVNTDEWQMDFFGLTMLLVIVINVAGAIFQGGVIGIASVFPASYMHAMVTGQSVAGIFAAVAQILSLMVGIHPTRSALIYFLCAVGTLVITVTSYVIVQKTAFFQCYMQEARCSSCVPKLPAGFDARSSSSIRTVLYKIWPYCLSIFLVFWVTLSIYPPVTALVVSQNAHTSSPWAGRFFLPLTCFLMYNCGDFVGRIVCGYLPLSPSWQRSLLTISWLRILFIPLVMLCNALPRTHLPVVIHSDAGYTCLIAFLALTHGYLFCVAMMHGPKQVASYQQEQAGTILAAFMGAGLISGSLTSLLLVNIL